MRLESAFLFLGGCLLACGPGREVRGQEVAPRPQAPAVERAEAASVPEFQGAEALLSPSEAKARPKRSKPLREPGYLYVTTDPAEAEIRVDDVVEGRGRVFLRTTGNRHRTLVVSAPGHETVEGVVELEEREVVKLRIALPRLGGRLTVLTEPPGAEVRLDDRPAGHTPITLRRLDPGPHRLSLTSGSWSWAGQVEVSPTETNLISMNMGGALARPAPAPAPAPAVAPTPAPAAGPTARPAPQTVPAPVAAPGRAPAPAPTPAPTPAPAPAPTPAPAPAPAVAPAPAPAPDSAPSGKPNCAAVCDRFVQAVTGSESIRDPIRNRCRERCGAGDMRFSVCAWKARAMEDVGTCMSLPESR